MKTKINKIIGKNYLHSHTITEYVKGIDIDHCIVDRKELEEIQKFFEDNPELIQWIGNGPIHRDFNTNIPFNVGSSTLINTKNYNF